MVLGFVKKRLAKKHMRVLFLFTALLMGGLSAFSQTKYSNEFLSIGVGARALGMSNAQVASVNDATAGFWNPAGLIGVKSNIQLGAMHSSWFASTAAYDYVTLALPVDATSTACFSMIRFGVDDIPDTSELIDPSGQVNYDKIKSFSAADYAFLFSYGKKTKIEGLSIGGTAKVIRRVIGEFAGAWGFGFDAGAQYKRGNWNFGVLGKDITTTFNAWNFNLSDRMKETFTKTNNVIPENSLEITLPKLIAGCSYKKTFAGNFSALAAMDMDITFDGRRNVLIGTKAMSIDPHPGIELGYAEMIYLRAGMLNFQQIKEFDGSKSFSFQPSFGLGLKIKNFHLEYALSSFGSIGQMPYSNVFSLKIDFFKRK